MNEFVDPFETKETSEEPADEEEQVLDAVTGEPDPNQDAVDAALSRPSPTLGAALVRASDLLPKQEDPLEAIPVEPPDDDTPPDDALPTFLVRRNRYGPGAHSVLLANGEPVGVWLDRERHDADPAAVHAELVALGLEEDLALQFADHRAQRMEAEASLNANPAVQRAASEETRRKAEKEIVQKAFLEAHKRKK